MRDLLIVLIYAAFLFWAVWKQNPFTAVMVYFWISFMNPHRYSWGFAYNLPLAMGAVLVTFLTLVLSPNQIKWPRSKEIYFFLVLWVFITITTVNAMYPEWAWDMWTITTKIFLMTLVAVLVINNKQRLLTFLLGIVGFIGLVGVKGAIFGMATGGKYRVWGPPDTFIADNNSVGLCMIMLVPLCFFLKDYFKKKWQQLLLFGTGGALAISAILTYSRGAFLGLMAVSLYYLTFSKHKVRVGLFAVIAVTVALNVLPPEWFNRMHSIEEYGEDRSANMRMNSWMMSVNLALHHPLGGGFDCFTLDNYEKYAPDPDLGKAKSGDGGVVGSTAHSIYFEVIATHGFGGLALYLFSIFSMIFTLRKLDGIGKKFPGAEWISLVSRGLTGVIIGFLVSGAFLSRAFFDLFWALYGAGISFNSIVMSGEWLNEIVPPDMEEDAASDMDAEDALAVESL